jgi:hypothetical protein
VTHTIAARVRNGKPWERSSVRIDKESDEIRASGHGLTNGTIVRFTEISRNGTGLSTGTNYYVRQAEENSFKVSTSPPGSGTVVDILENAEVDIRLFQDRYAGFLMTAYKHQRLTGALTAACDRFAAPTRSRGKSPPKNHSFALP